MKDDPRLPDEASQMLARFGSQIEYTENEPNGLVNLAGSQVANEDLRHLVFYPGFDALILDKTEISDAGLQSIGEMKNLEGVRLYDTLVSDDGLEHLVGLAKLERLNIACDPGCLPSGLRPVPAAQVRRNQITNRGLGYLTELPCLSSLSLKATRVTDAGLVQFIPEMPQINELSLAYLDISDESLQALESLVWLERINLRHTAITNDAIVSLVCGKAHTLRQLNLANTEVSDEALAECLPQSQLNNLSLMDTGITDDACKELADCEWLADLRLDLTDVTDDGVRDLTNCAHLHSLELFKTKITDTSLVWLSDTNVDYLGIGCTSITDAGIPALSDFPALRSLDLQGTLLTDRGLRFLSSAANLSRLHLEHSKISNAGIESLLHLSLETLSLNPKINNAGLKTLSNHKCLRRLAIWNCRVTNWHPLKNLDRLQVLLIDDSVMDLSPLRSLKQLEMLILWGDNFSPTELARLRLSLPKCHIMTRASCEPAIHEFRILCGGS